MARWDRDRVRRLEALRATALLSRITIRLAAVSDAGALERRAQLDSRPVPPGPHLIAEREGRIDAALSLSSGEPIADLFRHTAALCDLLRAHARGVRVAAPTPPLPQLQAQPMPATT